MDGNYSCSLCSQVAVQCCLCSTPRTYLCQTCVLPHTSSKRIYHPLLPASTPAYVTKDNLAEHDHIVTARGKLMGQLEVASSQLAAERNALDQVFTEVYNSQIQRLYEICAAVYADISGYYERLQTEVETFRRDLAAADQYVSEDTRKYIEASFHIPQSCTFLDAKEEINGRIQIAAANSSLATQNCLFDVASKWGTLHCSCSDCCECKAVLVCKQPPPLRPSLPASSLWTCPTCKYEYNLSQTCGKCGAKQQVPNMSAMPQASSVSIPNHCWVCPQCRYEYNMQNSCGRCGFPRPLAVAAPKLVAPTGLQTGTNPCWTCPSCNYGYNTANTCVKCGEIIKGPRKGPPRITRLPSRRRDFSV